MINWDIFWNAAGAIATFAAVLVALWQTRTANKKKLKLSFIENMTILPTVPIGTIGYMPKNQYIGIDVVNTGNRRVIIKSFWIELPNNVRAVIQPDNTPSGAIALPATLDIEESIFLPWLKSKFLSYLHDEVNFPRNQKLTFCVSDSTGVIYKCTTQKTVQEFLNVEKSEVTHD